MWSESRADDTDLDEERARRGRGEGEREAVEFAERGRAKGGRGLDGVRGESGARCWCEGARAASFALSGPDSTSRAEPRRAVDGTECVAGVAGLPVRRMSWWGVESAKKVPRVAPRLRAAAVVSRWYVVQAGRVEDFLRQKTATQVQLTVPRLLTKTSHA
jgi:hypothetical protein